VAPGKELVDSFHEEHERDVEGEVQEGPDLLADGAEVLELDVIEVELIDEVLRVRC